MLRQWALGAIAGGLLAAFAPAGVPAAQAAQAGACGPEAEPANLNFTLKDINGRDVALSSYAGKVILLNFWATWCGPCRIEIPGFVELHERYGSRGLVVVGLSVDDPVSKLRPFAAELKMEYPILIGDGRDDVKDAFPLLGLPTTFIIGRDGRICDKHTGLALKEQLEPTVRSLLAHAPGDAARPKAGPDGVLGRLFSVIGR